MNHTVALMLKPWTNITGTGGDAWPDPDAPCEAVEEVAPQ